LVLNERLLIFVVLTFVVGVDSVGAVLRVFELVTGAKFVLRWPLLTRCWSVAKVTSAANGSPF
jgi:hypothetical protein